ncbi:MAG TPA: hypothetical protein VFH97_02245 [Gemmatimonadales bacterium]|nr:hypothetical protein [Gemmatimonadales bacterium]
MRVEAGRLAARALRLIAADSITQTPAVLAELYYRRALPLLAWVRQFDHLIFGADVPVSTPACLESGYFCEAYARPGLFFERLAGRPRLDHLVENERRAARSLLDSSLARDRAHPGALTAALALAAREASWTRFRALADTAHRTDPGAATPLLALLTADLQLANRRGAAAWFDSLQALLGPEAVARFEGLALVADTALRERLRGDSAVIYAEALWGLSDPLYLSEANERRVEHYARVHLAELLFTDPESGRPGRDTPQGRLVIRYGLPHYVFVLQADQARQLSPSQRLMVDEILSCSQAVLPFHPGANPRGELPCGYNLGAGEPSATGGRWEFWYYGAGGAPFVFERSLGSWSPRHMFETASLRLDSLLHRTLPSLYAPPFRDAEVRSLVTRFPRPRNPGVEVWGIFESRSPASPSEPVRLGLFVHSRTNGKLVDYAIQDRWRAGRAARFDYRMPIPRGRYQLSVEGARYDRDDLAAQQRHVVDLVVPTGRDTLWLSDLLLGDSVRAADVITTRPDVAMFGRVDSVLTKGGGLALYWEAYGLGRDPAGSARYRVRVTIRRGDGNLVGAVVRLLGRVLGGGAPGGSQLEWEVTRPWTEVCPDVLELDGLPPAPELAVAVELTDLVTGRGAVSRRVVAVHAPQDKERRAR